MATKESEVTVVIRGKDELSPELKKIESSIIRAVGAISAALAGIKIGTAPIIAAAAFERELANVAKTTDFTVAQMNRLSDALLEISLTVDVSAVDLAKIAAAAGQQGLGKQGVDGVVQFTKSVSRMASVLDITAEEAAVNVGKIINIFKIPLSEVEKAVSVFNEVSNNSTANGKELLDVVKRIGDAAGALNLQQATGLAATGLDFGISPEVVGTAISRVFSAAFEKADEFGAVMKISATQWTESLQKDGLSAFRDFLAALRKLDSQSQQKAIVKLIGGGRIGALLNKLVQDTTDSVLLKNFQAAEEGLSGISAIREQAKVLDTLDAKVRILGNGFVKLGVDSAKALLEPLKEYTDALAETLETPAVKSFVDAAVKSIGQLLKVIVDAIKFISSLNINWENFLKVLEVFIGLKLFNVFTSLIGGMRVFGVELRAVGAAATAATTAVDGLAAAEKKVGKGVDASGFKASLRSRILGYEELSVRHQQRMAELAAEKKAEQQYINAARNLDKAQAAGKPVAADATQASRAAAVADANASAAKVALEKQQAVLLAAEKKTQDIREAEQKRFNDRLLANEEANKKRIIAAERAHATNIASIQRASAVAQLAQQRAVEARAEAERVKATPGFTRDKLAVPLADAKVAAAERGAEAAQKALAREQAATLAAYNKARAEQEKFHAAAIANISKYHAQRIAALEAVGSKEVAAEKAVLQQRLAAYTTFAAAQIEAQKAASLAGVAAASSGLAVANAAAQLDAAKTAAGVGTAANSIGASFTRMAVTVKAALAGIGLALRTLAGVAAAAGRILANAFFWVTLIYSVLDMTGALNKLAPALDKVLKFFGLTTFAEREARLESEKATAEWKKKEEALNSYTEAYRKALDTTGQNIDPKFIQQELEVFKITDDPERKKAALETVLGVIAGARAKQVALENRTTQDLQREQQAQQAILEKALADRERFTAQLERAKASSAKATPGSSGKASADQLVTVNTAFLDDANKRIEEATRKLSEFKEGTAATGREIARLGDQQKAVFAQVGTLLSKESIPALNQIVVPLAAAREELARMQAEYEGLGSVAKKEGGDASVAAAELERRLILQAERVAGLTKALESYKLSLASTVGATPEQIAQAELLIELARQRLVILQAIANQAAVNPEALSGAGLKPKPKPTGTQGFTGKDAAAEARKLAKAQLELARTRIQAENALADERAKQQLEREQQSYDLGLKAIKEYYDARERIQLEANARDVTDKGLEIQEVNRALQDPSLDKATRVGFESTKVRLQGQIAVLVEQRKGISDEIKRDAKAAQDAFNSRVTEETAAVFRSGVIPAEAQTVFDASMKAMLSRYSVFLDQLRTEGQGALADALIQGFSIDAFTASIESASREISLIFGNVQQQQERLSIARENGAVTTLEAEKAYSDEIKRQLPLMEDQLRIMEQQLSVLGQTQGIGSLAYREQAQAIDDLILRIQRLGQETDKVARDLNQGFTDSLESALNRLEPTFESLKETILSFLKDITDQVKGVFAKQIADSISQALGNIGTGGFGGFFQKLIDDILAKQAASALPDLGELGVNTALEAAPAATSAADAAATSAAAASLGAVAISGDASAVALASLAVPTNIVVGGFTSLSPVLLEAVAGLAALVGVAAQAAIAIESMAAAATASTVSSLVAHSGGVIGSTPLRRRTVHPAIFANAARYHSGGIVGLKSNEVPAILEKGEHVLTAQQAAAQKTAENSGNSGNMAIRNVLVTDPNFVPDAMATSQGEKVLVSFIQRNKASIRQMLGN